MLAKFSVKKPFTVVVGVVLILILGFVSFTEMTTDLLPSIDLPYAIVMTSYPGASPEEVETVVTKPVEQAMATISNVENISSTSSENISLVILEFQDDTNMDAITIDIRESLDMISGYWDDSIGSSTILKLNPDMLPVMVAAIDGDEYSSTEISELVDSKIVPQLESVEGVASVNASGLIEKEINVVIAQEKIDKINEKIKKSIEEQFADAKDKIEDAKSEIESGKSELESKKQELNSGMEDAGKGISNGKIEILKNELDIEKADKELSEKEAEALKSEEKLLTTEKELNEKKKEANEGLKKIQESQKELTSTENTLNTSKQHMEDSIEEINKNDQLTEEEKKISLTETSKKLKEVESSLTKIKETKESLKLQKTEIEKGLKEIEKGLKETKAGKEKLSAAKKELEKARKEIDTAKEKIESGKDSLLTKEVKLNEEKDKLGEELSSAEKELIEGESEIKSQIEGIDENKNQAIESADVSKTITRDMISQILQAQNFTMPAGYVTEEGVDYLVRVGEKIEDIEELSNLVLFDLDIEGMEPVKLSDVADVFATDNSAESYAKINGNDGIILSMQKQTTYSTAEVSDSIQKKFDSIKEEYSNLNVTYLMDQGMYIDLVVNSVLNNLIFGAILAIVILFLFLRDIRPTFMIACSIPISVVFAIALMYFSGVTLNIISLSGLAVGVGMLVDNSVVVIENIYRLRNKGVSAIKAAVSGAVQVAGAITSSTLTTVCVFLPIVFVKGITKQLFLDMALTIGYSLGASLIIALTLVPMMSAGMLKRIKQKKISGEGKLLKIYEKIMRWVISHRAIVMAAAVILLILSAIGELGKGTELFPDMDSTQVSVTVNMPEGSIFADTSAMADKVTSRILEIEDVDTVGAMIGGSSGMSMMGGSSSEGQAITVYAILKENKKLSSNDIADLINEKCSDLDCEVSASGSNMDMSALGGSGISIQIKGMELDKLQNIAHDISKIVGSVEGVTDVSDGMENPTPEIKIVINKEKAMLNGLTVAQAYMEIKDALVNSTSSTNLNEDGDEYSVVVIDSEEKEMSRDDIKDYVFKVTDKSGEEKEVLLKDIADVTEAESLSSINRDSQQRYITVSAGLKDGYNIGIVGNNVKNAIDKYEVPKGYEIKLAGENESINESMKELVKMLLLAIAFIYLIMAAQFQSLMSPFIVLFTIPLAFTGGLLGLFFTGNEISIVGMIGFVMLSGVVVNNGIVLVDYINQLRLEGMEKHEAIIEAGKTRMRPIFMTALTTILGLSTMALGVGMGSEMMQPVAIVTIGGLIYATIMTLFVVPVMYDFLSRKNMKKVDESELDVIDE